MTEAISSVRRRFEDTTEVDRWYGETMEGLARIAGSVYLEFGRDSLNGDLTEYFGGLIRRLAVARERAYEALTGARPETPPIGLNELLTRALA